MQAVIMAGGEGTRLRPLTRHRPKPMLPVLNKPMMEFIITHLKRYGIKDIIVTLFYQGSKIVDYFGDGADWGVRIRYAVEDEPLGTAGSVKNAATLIKEPFIVISGDAVLDLDLGSVIKFHRSKKADVTITLKKVSNPLEYGIVLLNKGGSIKRFLEKPGWGEVFSDAVNTGIYIVQPRILKLIPRGEKYDFSKDLFPDMLRKKRRLYGCVAKGYWTDVGDLDEYRAAHRHILEERLDMEIPGSTIKKGVWIGEGVELSENARIDSPCFIGNYCRVGDGVQLGKFTVLGDGVVVDTGSEVNRSIIMRNSYIGEQVTLRNSIIAENVVLEEKGLVHEGAVVGANCSVGRMVEIRPNVKIWPDKEIEEGAVIADNLVWQSYQAKTFFRGGRVLGLANIRITPEFGARLGSALGTYYGKGSTVIVSRDASPASRLIKRAVSSGMLSQGVDLYDLEISPSPFNPYAIRLYGASGGVHIRTSEVHHEVMQIDCLASSGEYLDRSSERKIEIVYHRQDHPPLKIAEVGKVFYTGRLPEVYKDELFQVVSSESIRHRGFCIVVDCNYGSGSQIAPDVFGMLGCQVITLGTRSTQGYTLPHSKRNFHRIRNLTRYNADMGVLLWPNVDGFYLFDERGKLIPEQTVQLLIAKRVWEAEPGSWIQVPVTATAGMERLAGSYAGKVVRTKVDGRPKMSVRMPRRGKIPDVAKKAAKYFYSRMDPIFSICKILEYMSAALRDYEGAATLESKGCRDQVPMGEKSGGDPEPCRITFVGIPPAY
jgi:mannose-1-phosphate guanylyltransferase/phosphomannomutase